MLFIIFLIWSSGSPPIQWSQTIYVILVEDIMGNNHVNSILNLGQWFMRRYCLKKNFTDEITPDYDRSLKTKYG